MPAATYNHALHRANVWLADVTNALGTHDRHYGQRVLGPGRTCCGHMSPGQVAETLAELPTDLVATVRDGADVREGPGGRRPAEPSAALEDRINALGEAVRTLARGLEDEDASGQRIDASQVTRAARLAEEILVVGGR